MTDVANGLPPEMVEALRRRLARFGVSDPEVMANSLADEITPLLAERWEGLKEACRRELAHHFALPDAGLAVERDAAQAEARRLREALEAADAAVALGIDLACGQDEESAADRAELTAAHERIRAALSASPDPGRRPDGDSWTNERVAEHLRGRFETSRSWIEVAYDARSIFTGHGPPLNDDLSAPSVACDQPGCGCDCHAAASSSSSEEGERAEHDRAYWNEAAIEAARADAVRALRERLTSDEAVGVADAGWRSATVPALEAARVELRERGHAECIRREQLRGALSALADFLLNDREEGR